MPRPMTASPASSAVVKPEEIWACVPFSATVSHQETLFVLCSGGHSNCWFAKLEMLLDKRFWGQTSVRNASYMVVLREAHK